MSIISAYKVDKNKPSKYKNFTNNTVLDLSILLDSSHKLEDLEITSSSYLKCPAIEAKAVKNCPRNLKSLTITHLVNKKLPIICNSTLERLTISGKCENLIDISGISEFKKLKHLEIVCKNDHVIDLPKDVFKENTNLRTFRLGKIKFTATNESLAGLKNLWKIHLDEGTVIEDLPSGKLAFI